MLNAWEGSFASAREQGLGGGGGDCGGEAVCTAPPGVALFALTVGSCRHGAAVEDREGKGQIECCVGNQVARWPGMAHANETCSLIQRTVFDVYCGASPAISQSNAAAPPYMPPPLRFSVTFPSYGVLEP